MRRLPLPVLVLVLAACADNMPAGPQLDGPDFARAPVPFSGSCHLAIQPATPVGPGIVHQIDEGECRVSHMGKTTYISDKIINFVAGTQETELTLIAANGDEIHGAGNGVNAMTEPGRVDFRAEIDVTGGTGRFANVSGRLVVEGYADIVNGRSYPRISGNLVY